MKLSSKSRYAVRCMISLAKAKDVQSINEISEKQELSQRFLELIFARLKKGGLIKSVRGSLGGYQLAKQPSAISIYDILKVIETDLKIVKQPRKASKMMNVLNQQIWNPIDQNIEAYLKGITLDSLI